MVHWTAAEALLLALAAAVGVLVPPAASGVGVGVGARAHVHALDGAWTLTNKARGLQLGARVPGGVYSDMRAAGHLPEDVFHRFNDVAYRWVAKENWTYERSFQVPGEAVGKAKQVLVLHGVDTVADVYLNGHRLGHTDNMFLRYRFDVKGLLKEDASNLLEVHFTSPVLAARARAAEQAKQYVVPPECPGAEYHGECHVNLLRKMQASFAWDWGPAFPSMGLWKSVTLEAYDEAVLREVGFSARPAGAVWEASVRVHWEAGAGAATPLGGGDAPSGVLTVVLTPADGGTPIASEEVPVILVPDAHGLGHTDVNLTVPQAGVQRWWPQGYGSPHLYRLTVTLRPLGPPLRPPLRDQGGARNGHRWDQVDAKVGFRTVELVQEEVVPGDPAKGLTFFFRVNGVPVFAKGSNWIPAHVLPELGADPGVVGHLLHSAKEANMNMLRVWGGGVYESDTFYQLADELGIMIWQDLMFACAMYPVGDDFLRSVDAEVRQQHRRLNHHPSIVLWAGNNENEAALRGNWYSTRGPLFERYHRDYVTLYVRTARAALRDEGVAVPFAVSSPSNGVESEAEDFLAKNPYSPLYGDDHHYDYVSDAWNPSVFHHTRFGSEYGFMSWPARATLLEATDAEHAAEDLALGSALAAHRQHHRGGNAEMVLQALQHLPLPARFNDSQHFDTFVYFSQIYQAMATKTETEFLRRSRHTLSARGEGRTMGALYWQLNDVWQAPSWASIDFAGRWKMLHHYAVDFLAPLIVSPHVQGGLLHVDVLADVPPAQDVLVRTDVLAMDSFAPRAQRLDAWTRSSPRAYTAALGDLLARAGCAAPDARWGCVLRFRLMSGNDTQAQIAPDNFLFPRSPKDTPMPTTHFQVTGARGPLAGTAHQRWDFSLRLAASSPAAFVWLEAGPLRGRFSRNGFHVTEAAPLELRFHTDEDVTAAELDRHLTVTSLNGAYPHRHRHRVVRV